MAANRQPERKLMELCQIQWSMLLTLFSLCPQEVCVCQPYLRTVRVIGLNKASGIFLAWTLQTSAFSPDISSPLQMKESFLVITFCVRAKLFFLLISISICMYINIYKHTCIMCVIAQLGAVTKYLNEWFINNRNFLFIISEVGKPKVKSLGNWLSSNALLFNT